MAKATKVTNVGKGAKGEHLPSRFAQSTVTPGDPIARGMGNYAKGATAPDPMAMLEAPASTPQPATEGAVKVSGK